MMSISASMAEPMLKSAKGTVKRSQEMKITPKTVLRNIDPGVGYGFMGVPCLEGTICRPV